MLADVDAGDGGADRVEFAANPGGGVGLQIDHVLVRRPAGQEDHDDRLVRAGDARLGLGAEDLRQRQSAQGKAADLQEVSPGRAVAEMLPSPEDGQHADSPPMVRF